jgi:tetratricopeptide (TPR) repeat protein
MTFVWIDSKNKRQINTHYGDVLHAMAQDKHIEYKNALELGKKIYEIDSDHALTQATMAYAHAVLAVEHGLEDSMPKAKEELRKALEQPDEQNPWRYAAAALIAYSEGNIEDGIAGIKDVADKSSNAVIQMEHFRLRWAQDPTAEMTKKALAKTTQTLTSDARVFNFLGWHYFKQENWQKADTNFTSATQNVRGHEAAIIGGAMTDLERGIGIKERQKDIEKNLKKVFGLPEEELSQPIKALAHFARAQLRNWQDNEDEAKKDYDEASKMDPKSSLFPYRRGVAESKLGHYQAAVEHLKEAVKMEPNDAQYLIKLAQAQIGAGDTAGAEQTIKRGLELAKDNAELLLARGDMLRTAKDYDEAIKAYEALDLKTHTGPDFAKAQIGIAAVHRERGKAPLAVKHIEDFLGKAPASVSKDPQLQAELWGELGQAYEAAGKDTKAEECYNVGVEQFRYYPDNHYQLCRMKGWKGAEAKSFCALYITLAPRGKYAEEIKKRIPGIEKEASKGKK